MAEIKKISTELQLLDKFLDTSGDAGTSGQVLSSTGTGINWVSGGSLPGGPYLPLAGGTMSGNTNHSDNVKDIYGTGNDFQIWHDGSNTFLSNEGEGHLNIINTGDDRDIIFKTDDGSGATTSYMVIDGSAEQTRFYKDTRYTDGVKANFGNSDDLQIFHSADSYITNNSGALYIQTLKDDGDIIFRSDNGSGGITSYLTLDGSTTHAYFSNPGNVGIGTTSPSLKLQVVSSSIVIADFNTTSTKGGIKISEADEGGYLSTEANRICLGSDIGVSNNNLSYHMGTNSLGIGTGNPTTPLHIKHDAPSIRLEDNTSSDNHYLTGNNGEFRVQSTGYITIRPGNTVSTRFDANGNVGIGTTAPSQKLHVDGVTYSTSGYKLNNGFSISALGYNSAVRFNNGNILINNSSSSEFVRFDATNSRVGIGTTSPSEKLQVNSSSNPSIKIQDTTNSFAQKNTLFFNQNIVAGQTDVAKIYTELANGATTSLDNPLKFATAQRSTLTMTDRMVIDNLGNVGIGTNSPANKLHVHGQGASIYSVFARSDSKWMYLHSGASDPAIGWDTGGDMRFGTATSSVGGSFTERMRITSSGNVGIGTTSPSQKLHIDGGIARFSNNSSNYLQIDGSDAANNHAIISNRFNQLQLKTNTGAGAPHISLLPATGGNVGIGTSSPSEKLHVAGNIKLLDKLTFTEHSTNDYLLAQSYALSVSGDESINFRVGGTSVYNVYGTQIRPQADNTIDLGHTGYGWKTVRAAGNITTSSGALGIGTQYPSGELHVKGANPEFILEDTTNPNKNKIQNTDGNMKYHADYESTQGNSRHTFFIDGSEKVRFNTDGNVGIGTTNPLAKLQVSSTSGWGVFTERGIKDGSTSTYSHSYGAGNAHVLGRSTIFESSVTFSTLTASAATKEYRLKNSSNKLVLASVVAGITTENNILVADGVNIGIGTDSPSEKLEVYDGNIKLTDGTRSLLIGEEGGSSYQINSSGYLIVDATSGIQINKTTSGNVTIASGNVGIGTTSPSAKLDVAGAVRIPYSSSNLNFFIQDNDSIGFGKMTPFDNTGFYSFDTNYTSNGGYKFKYNGSEKIRIDHSGNVGIGTTSPSEKLDVNGAISASDYIGSTNVYLTSPDSWIFRSTGGSTRMQITSAGNVGIGTTSPNAKLNINGSVKIESTNPLYFGGTTSVPNWEIKAYGSGGNDLLINDTGTNSGDLIFTGQDFGVGTTNPLEKLHVSGEPHPSIRLSSSSDSNYNVVINCGYRNEALNLSVGGYKVFTTEGYNTPETTHLYSNNSKALSLASNQAATFTSTVTATNFINSSDERLKENIEKVCNNSLDVQWKTFEFKSDRGQKRYGVIAQELEKTNPEFVREDAEGFKSVAYIDLLIAKIAELEERIQTLENK